MRVISTAVAAVFLAVSTLGVSAAPLASVDNSGAQLILQKKPVKKAVYKAKKPGKKIGCKGKKTKMIKKTKITKHHFGKKLKAQPTLAR
jgi:hypothetical protein